MSNIVEYKDIMAFHPGYYVADIIDDMGISQADFAVRMGTTAKTLSQLINGQAIFPMIWLKTIRYYGNRR